MTLVYNILIKENILKKEQNLYELPIKAMFHSLVIRMVIVDWALSLLF